MFIRETHEYKDFIIEIVDDDAPISPRAWDNLGVMVCWYHDYDLGDGLPERLRQRFQRWDMTEIEAFVRWKNLNRKHLLALPLYLYDHSALAISTTPFGCRFDSGQVGWIYATHDRLKEAYGTDEITPEILERTRQGLLAEVEVYDQYLGGDVWGYVIREKDKKRRHQVLANCFGFYGQQGSQECLKQARETADAQEKKQLPLLFL
jgi:hypothetical protein